MQGGGSKAQKDKPEGPSHTLEAGWACCLLPSLPGGLLKTLWTGPQPSLGGGGGCGGGGGGELLLVVCYQIVPKLLKWRSSQLQQQKDRNNECPTPK